MARRPSERVQAVAFVAVLCAILIPFLPIAFLVFCVWVIARLASRPAYAR